MWHLQSVLRIGLLICVIRKAQSCYHIVEKGKATEFTCTVPNNFTIITWQTLTGTNALNLTTCNMATSVCTDQQPSVYHGLVVSSVQGTYTMELSIKSARINETRFRCFTDGGASKDECELEVYTPDGHVIVEKGQNTQLECPVQGNVKTLTWQVWADGQYANVSSCPPAGACVDHMSQVYNGTILNAAGVSMFTLNINGVRSNETIFRCLTDDGKVVKTILLEPYRWPSTPTSRGISLTNQYVEVTFSTVAYPDVDAVLHRRKIDLSDDDFDRKYCSHSLSSSDPNSDYNIACTWRILFAKMLLSNTFYVEMSARVDNQTLVNRSPAVSNDTVQNIGAVTVSLNNCPQNIRKDTSATCTCTTSSSGFFRAHAQWFTADKKVVGVEDSSHGSSTLTVSFNSSDPNPTYECRGINPTREYPYITYEPKLSSSAPGCAITWILFLLAVCTGLSSTLL